MNWPQFEVGGPSGLGGTWAHSTESYTLSFQLRVGLCPVDMAVFAHGHLRNQAEVWCSKGLWALLRGPLSLWRRCSYVLCENFDGPLLTLGIPLVESPWQSLLSPAGQPGKEWPQCSRPDGPRTPAQ